MRADEFLDGPAQSADDFLNGPAGNSKPPGLQPPPVLDPLGLTGRKPVQPPISVLQTEPAAPFDFAAASRARRAIDDAAGVRGARVPQVATVAPPVDDGFAAHAARVLRRVVGGLNEGTAGVVRAGADVVGLDSVADFAARSAGAGRAYAGKTVAPRTHIEGFTPGSVVQDLPGAAENAAVSIGTQAPALALAELRAVLAALGLQSFGQQYGQVRDSGLDVLPALVNAGATAGFEVLGERVGGMPGTLNALKGAIAGNAPARVAADMVRAGVRDIPGEQITHAGQFAVDAAPVVGTNANPSADEFLTGAKDTALTTVLQGGMMAGAGSTLAKARELAGRAGGTGEGVLHRLLGQQAATPALAPEAVQRGAPLEQAAPAEPAAVPAGPGQGMQPTVPAVDSIISAIAAADRAAAAGRVAAPAAQAVHPAPATDESTPQADASGVAQADAARAQAAAPAPSEQPAAVGAEPAPAAVAEPEQDATLKSGQVDPPLQRRLARADGARLGVDSVPLEEGGQPFADRDSAKAAKKLHPSLRVTKVEGGFALVEKSAAQLAAETKAARRIQGAAMDGPGTPLSAHAFVIGKGGLDPSAMADAGFDRNPRLGNRHLFVGKGRRGLTLAQAAELLREAGYIADESESAAADIIRRSVQSPQFTPEGWERVAQAEAEARFQDYLEAQQDEDADPLSPVYEYTDEQLRADPFYAPAADAITADVVSLMAQAEASGIDVESLLEDVARQAQDQTEQDYYERTRETLATAVAGVADGGSDETAEQAERERDGQARPAGREDRGAPDREEGTGEGLSSYTREDLARREEQREDAEAAQKRADREAVQRAQAEAGRDDFTLTGSDREADQAAARGQEPLFDIGRMFDGGPMSVAPEQVRANTLARLKALERRIKDGDLTVEQYRDGVHRIIEQIEARNLAQLERATKDRERGPDWVQERLLRARRKGELDRDAVDFALWALGKNPALATDLAISLPSGGADGIAGDYNRATRVMRLFKSQMDAETVVHEILHHTERMMPVEIQNGILKAYSRAWDKAWAGADDARREAMQDMIAGGMGDKAAHERLLKAFNDGVLSYDQHYQLVNASEYWAVNATDIMAKRFGAEVSGAWVAKAKQWLSELLERVKGWLGLPSDTPVLKGLRAILDGTGARLSGEVLAGRDTPLNAPTRQNAARRDQTETPEFKAWFGDWQALRAEKRLDAMEPVRVKVPEAWRGLPVAELRERVREVLDDLVRRRATIEHPELGTVRVARAGERKTISEGRDPAKLLIAADLEKVLPVAVLSSVTPSREQERDSFAKLVARVDVDGVVLVAMLTVRQQPDGDWYYNTVALEEGRPEGSNREPSLHQEHPPKTGLREFSRKRLERVNPSTVSKVVGDDGRPLVLYHGSRSADIGNFRPGTYFTEAADEASDYARGGAVYPVYLSIKNPYEASDEQDGENRSELTEIDESYAEELGARGFDGVVARRNGETLWALPFRPEQVKSATGNRGTFDLAAPRILRDIKSGGGDKPKSSRSLNPLGRDQMGHFKFKLGEVAFHKLDAALTPMLTRFNMRMATPELRRQLRQMKATIEEAGRNAAKVAEQMSVLEKADREMVSDIVEKVLKPGVVPPEHAVRVADAITKAMDRQTDELVELGMLTPASAERWRGRYLPRIYSKHLELDGESDMAWWHKMMRPSRLMRGVQGENLKGRGLFEDVPVEAVGSYQAMGWEVRDGHWEVKQGKLELKNRRDTPWLARSKVVMWRDFTMEEREQMGEMRDSLVRYASGYTAMQRDIAMGRLFENIARNPAWVRRSGSEGWKQVPNTEIPGSGGVKRYGHLAGLWVQKDIMAHLTQFEEAADEALQLWRDALGIWKEGKTVLNPVAHFNNVASNVSMAHFAGVSYWDGHKYLAAVRDLMNDAPMVQEGRDVGLFTGSFTKEELVQAMPKELQKLMALPDSAARKAGRQVMNALTYWLRQPLQKAYEFEDTFFKYVIYRDARQQGMNPEDATDYALRYIFTYDDLPSGARMVRDSAIPFFAWSYKAMPALLHTAMVYPWRFLAPAALLHGINLAAYAVAAGDEDDDWMEKVAKGRELEEEERAVLPDHMKGVSMLANPKSIRLGTDSLTGNPVFLDVSRVIPGGDMFDMENQAGGVPVPAPLMPNHPVLTVFSAMVANKEMFMGREVTDANDTGMEAAEKRAKWMAGFLLPAIAPGGYHSQRVLNATASAADTIITVPGMGEFTGVDRAGQPVRPGYAAMQTVGIKARPVDVELEAGRRRADDSALVKSIAAEVRSMARLHQRGAASDAMMERVREKAQEKLERIREEAH